MKAAIRRQDGNGACKPSTDRGGNDGRVLTVSLPALIVDGSDSEFRRLVYALVIVSDRFDRLREELGRMIGLSGRQYHILMVVEEQSATRPVSVGSVADALHVSGAYITMETAKLVRKKLLRKRTNPRDRRGVLLSLTPSGRRAVRISVPHLRRINDCLFAPFNRADFRSFRRIMDNMVEGTEQALAMASALVPERSLSRGDGTE